MISFPALFSFSLCIFFAGSPAIAAQEINAAGLLSKEVIDEQKVLEDKERQLLDDAFDARPVDIHINRNSNVLVDGGFLLQPGSFFEVADPGDELVRTITILSKAGEDAIFEVYVRDLGADPESGTPRFYQPGQVGPFPAKEWLQPSVKEIALHHGELVTIPITLTIPAKADAGDHMAAIMIKRKQLTEKSGGVKVNAYTSIIFVVSVRGDVITNGSFISLKPERFINWSLPARMLATVRNAGTVQIAPVGSLTFRNIFGIPVDEISLPTWHVLRGTAHTKYIEWLPKFAFGYYTVSSDIHFEVKTGDSLPANQLKSSFLVIPLVPTLLVLLAIFTVSFLVQFVKSRFEIKRKV